MVQAGAKAQQWEREVFDLDVGGEKAVKNVLQE